jgi:hypothetical protein
MIIDAFAIKKKNVPLLDKYGYVMDISKNIKIKLSFESEVYQKLSQQLSVLDTFKGSWNEKEDQQGQYLK